MPRSECAAVLAALAVGWGCGKELNPAYCAAHPEDALCQTTDVADAAVDGAVGPASCPDTYTGELVGSTSRYRLVEDTMTWKDAAAACASDDAGTGSFTHLLVLSDPLEHAILDDMRNNRWIGFSRSDVTGTLQAVTDEVVDYPALTMRLPPTWNLEDTTPADCVLANSKLQLEDDDCTKTLVFACECDIFPDVPDHYPP